MTIEQPIPVIKLCQIIDNNVNPLQNGLKYIEDENKNVLNNTNVSFPLQVSVEVITWASEDERLVHGKINEFNVEIVTVPDNSVSIRQSVFNQLVSKYPSLVI